MSGIGAFGLNLIISQFYKKFRLMDMRGTRYGPQI
jgi:hypothetical protein